MWFLDGSWDMHDGMGWWMLWGGLMMVLFWGTVLGVIAWAVTRLPGRQSHDTGSALDVARRRYANGEISREEFAQIRDDLTHDGSA